jgi:hypothetical protein
MIGRKYLVLGVACLVAAVLTGCASNLVYTGQYFHQYCGTELSAKATDNCGVPASCEPVAFVGNTVQQTIISTNTIRTDVVGRAKVNVVWPPNVYEVAAVDQSGYLPLTSFPAALTIVGPTAQGEFAGGVVKSSTFVVDILTRTMATPRQISFGFQNPADPTTLTPTLLVIDNDYPTGPVVTTATEFETARLMTDTDDFAGLKITGVCLLSKNAGAPAQRLFTAFIVPDGKARWKFQLTVTNQNKCVVYDIPQAVIEKGGVTLRPAP